MAYVTPHVMINIYHLLLKELQLVRNLVVGILGVVVDLEQSFVGCVILITDLPSRYTNAGGYVVTRLNCLPVDGGGSALNVQLGDCHLGDDCSELSQRTLETSRRIG